MQPVRRNTIALVALGIVVGLGARMALASIAVNAQTPTCVNGICSVPVLDAGIVMSATEVTVPPSGSGGCFSGSGPVASCTSGSSQGTLYWDSTSWNVFANNAVVARFRGDTGLAELIYGYKIPSNGTVVNCDGNGCSYGSKNAGSCTLNGASPSTCTATVIATTHCGCYATGTTAAAGINLAANLVSTTLTCTGPNGNGSTVNYICL
jgi:hypothetical protein